MSNEFTLQTYTPNSDFAPGFNYNQAIWGRTGNDTVLGLQPLTPRAAGQLQIDVLIGDVALDDPEFRTWNDTFILGDWDKPYYANGRPGTLGLNDYGVILDFNRSEDSIQLYGRPNNYQLIELDVGTAIALRKPTGLDVVGVVLGNSNLNLNASYFEFRGYAPPPGPVIPQIKQSGTLGQELAFANTTDRFGNVYVAGGTTGSLGAANNGDSRDPFVIKYDSQGNQLFTVQIGTSSFDTIYGIDTDAQGNFYVTGITEGDLAAPVQAELSDAWVAKYDSQGNQVWIRQFGSNNLIFSAFNIDVDDAGNSYVTGVDVAPGPFPAFATDNYWVTKFDTNGNQVWFTEVQSPPPVFNRPDLNNLFGLDFDESYTISVANDGNIYTGGWTLGDLAGLNEGAYDAVVTKFNNNGQVQWIRQFGTEDYERATGVGADSKGNVYAAGWTLGNLAGQNAGGYDPWLGKFDSQGNLLWIRQFGSTGDDEVFDLYVDANDNVFVTGFTNGSLGRTNAGNFDAWAARFDANGNQIWIQQFGSPDFDQAYAIKGDNAGNIYLTGTTQGSLGSANIGSFDSWTAKLDAQTGQLRNFNANPQQNANRLNNNSPRLQVNTNNSSPLQAIANNSSPLQFRTNNSPTLQANTNNSSPLPVALLNETIFQVYTPYSDLSAGFNYSQLNWARSGNDTLIGLQPLIQRPPGGLQLDIMIGDLAIDDPALRTWNDTFILGDWDKPYYANGNPAILGTNDFAFIVDFNRQQDVIQLYGNPSNYQLLNLEAGTAIALRKPTGLDVVGFVLGNSNLSLTGSYFQYRGFTPPKPVLPQVWHLGTPGFDITFKPATDRFGNVYVAGGTTGSVGAPNNGDSRDGLVVKYDNKGNQLFAVQVGTPAFDTIYGIDTDPQGNFYVAGITEGDLAAPKQGVISDAWVAKYDPQGNQLWIRQFGRNQIFQTYAIDVDENGNAYLTGIDVEQRPGGLLASDDFWVTKFDTNGNQIWFTEVQNSANARNTLELIDILRLDFDESYRITVGNDGSVYTGGWTLNDLAAPNAGVYDAWVSKFNNNGQLHWIRQLGTSDYEWTQGVGTDSQGNVYATGWTLGNLGGQNAGSYDTWLAKFDSQGNLLWIRQFGGTADDAPSNLFIDKNDNIFLAGYTNGNFGGVNAGNFDAWAARYDTNGNQIWIQQFGTPDFDQANGITGDNAGNIYVTGATQGSLGGVNAGSFDSWTAKLDARTGALIA